MPFVTINEILVNYPYPPYQCQSNYMEKIIEALEKGQNAVLESPTGTGKTLCLLCSCLAWLAEQRSKLHRQNWDQISEEIDSKNGMRMDNNHSFGDVTKSNLRINLPKVIYTSRTHSQLTQVIREFKKTAYANQFKMSILGSRDQMCINGDVIRESNSSNKIKMCQNKIKNRACHFYNQVDKKISYFTNSIYDIEDLVINGRKNNCCPYYVSKELGRDADIIFMPYNYLIDYKIRKTHSIDLNNSIVIFDEAHNLEQICEDSASFSLSSFEIAALLSDLDATLKNIEGLSELTETIPEASQGSDIVNIQLTMEEVINLKEYALRIEKSIEEHTLNNPLTLSGNYILNLFIKSITTFPDLKSLLEIVQRCIDFSAEFSFAEGRIASMTRGIGLNKLLEILHIVDFAMINSNLSEIIQKKFDDNYKVYLCVDKDSKTTHNTFQSKFNQRILNCWCFSSAYTITALMNLGIRNLILTSGTLSPINVFATSFGIKFDIILENPHVIDAEKQVWIGIIKKGPDGTNFTSKFTERKNINYLKSLGNGIVNFAQIIPKGILLFFPSYSVMDLCLENWATFNIKKSMEKNKPLFLEDKNKSNFEAAVSGFIKKIEDSKVETQSNIGAIFAGVCRGKLSEGIDFADDFGRAVIITGLPFPPLLDPKIKLKMEFMNIKKRLNQSLINGSEWYQLQALSAVNQAIGRVIRYKEDFGAILLCDERFTSFKDSLPSWLRPHIKIYTEFGKVVRDLSNFFKAADLHYSANKSSNTNIIETEVADNNKKRKENFEEENFNCEKLVNIYGEVDDDTVYPETKNAQKSINTPFIKALEKTDLKKLIKSSYITDVTRKVNDKNDYKPTNQRQPSNLFSIFTSTQISSKNSTSSLPIKNSYLGKSSFNYINSKDFIDLNEAKTGTKVILNKDSIKYSSPLNDIDEDAFKSSKNIINNNCSNLTSNSINPIDNIVASCSKDSCISSGNSEYISAPKAKIIKLEQPNIVIELPEKIPPLELLDLIKRTLSASSMSQLKKCLCDYRETNELEKFIEKVKELFDPRNEIEQFLLLQLTYIPRGHHRQEFLVCIKQFIISRLQL